jgi:hypothetical protein
MDLQKIITKKLGDSVFMAGAAQYVALAGQTMFATDDPCAQIFQLDAVR